VHRQQRRKGAGHQVARTRFTQALLLQRVNRPSNPPSVYIAGPGSGAMDEQMPRGRGKIALRRACPAYRQTRLRLVKTST
jgi:hypothetical protein